VLAMATFALLWARAPIAISVETSSLVRPNVFMVPAFTSNQPSLAEGE